MVAGGRRSGSAVQPAAAGAAGQLARLAGDLGQASATPSPPSSPLGRELSHLVGNN